MSIQEVTEGDAVRAFHPRMFGVVKDARVVKIGRKYLHLDFGIWGTAKVLPREVVGHSYDWRS